MTGLPRNEDGDIITSAEFGETHIVQIEWVTDYDGRVVDPEKEEYPRTLHGPFTDEAEAVEWMNAYPEDMDVHDMTAITLNRVRPATPTTGNETA